MPVFECRTYSVFEVLAALAFDLDAPLDEIYTTV
jgi:hypothetical protein